MTYGKVRERCELGMEGVSSHENQE